ncbi:MAG: flagellar hook-basal body complex protein FliE [Planctomycetota bacterium]|jgi:flagellar hook-basal body complex protein FliE|nr:flagellar hook-basal body complex protein FliE [Planctomycetota bacterium]
MSDFDIPSFSTPVSYTNVNAPKKTADAKASKEIMGESFGNTLKGFVEDVNMAHGQADKTVEDLVTGRTDNLHKAVIAMNKAELSFRYMMEVRTKLVQAYQEIQRIQV